ncbi:hypothetical protein [Legionella clemsonensis]|nr:hypothetical protein [Legionella clemsonensis]
MGKAIKNSHLIKPATNQNCAEAMLIKAAQLVLKKNVQFQYSKVTQDVQVDISPAFLFSEDEEKQYWVSGDKRENLEHDLQKLDKRMVYFLRTGSNGGPGHWQILYFNRTKGWIIYSSEVNNFQLTQGAILTQQGLGLLSPFATWGYAQGQYCFLIVQASPKNIINTANYLYDYRMLGEAEADKNLWDAKDNFYREIRVDEDIKEPLQLNTNKDLTTEASDMNANTVKLTTIITALKENIAHQRNGRKTVRNSDWKRELLTTLQNRLKNNPDSDVGQCIHEVRKICKMKRNFFHFWSEPHSVSEFERLLEQELPELSQNPVF